MSFNSYLDMFYKDKHSWDDRVHTFLVFMGRFSSLIVTQKMVTVIHPIPMAAQLQTNAPPLYRKTSISHLPKLEPC